VSTQSWALIALPFALLSSWLDGFGLHGEVTSTRAAKFWMDESSQIMSQSQLNAMSLSAFRSRQISCVRGFPCTRIRCRLA